ncbi:hypothetical protein OIU84_007828 [Salix udensis]|uniref:Rhodanese domain-containing protein n=1 Tax=Salix udensis TaxID=889485 RepID=A0AAD6NZY8_9ROSI|nr:hypothetical protein OIU84_007828 [Salix udensis]
MRGCSAACSAPVSLSTAKIVCRIVNFYRFVLINDPLEEVAKHLSFLKRLDIHGRIYVNEQGINAQYSGPSKDALAYVEWIREDFRFSDILVQISPALNGHAFPKLEGGISHLPLLDPTMRATPLAPSEWRKRLKEVHDSSCVVLDVRNGYEWDIGHFHGAQRPDVDCFRSTSFGESNSEEAIASDPLANVDKEKTNILMYCTGGIRCDVYSTILRQRGFQNLYTLKGGVSHYLQNEGPVEWFVNELRHRNCANIDCNLLFLCCMDCVKDFKGCCCLPCTSAPRLRPVLPGNQRYKKWYMYRELEAQKFI